MAQSIKVTFVTLVNVLLLCRLGKGLYFHGKNSLPALSLCVSKALDVLTFLMKRNVLSNNVHFPSSFPIFCAK